MKLHDFDLARMLAFDPDEGRLSLGPDRMLLFRQEAFAFLRTLLVEQLGERLARAMLTQFGYLCGKGDYAALSVNFDWESETDRLGCGPVMHSWEGIVHVTPLAMSYDRETGHFLFRGIWRNSYEAEIHLNRFGRSDRPVCSSLTGYASGWSSAFFGRRLLCVETRCEGMGHEHCEWVIRPWDEWEPDNEDAAEARRTLEADSLSIARDLERTVERRTAELRAALEKVEEQNRALAELDQMKTEFLANVSHELRTPLTLVLGPLERLLDADGPGVPDEVRSSLDRVLRNGRRLERLVDELLDFSRLEAGRKRVDAQPLDIPRFVSGLVEDARSQAELLGLTISFTAPATMPEVLLDPQMLERILVNLIGNALKFTPAEGRIDVEVREHADRLHLVVRDTGPGIPAEAHEAIFERFRQLDASSTRAHGGTGLGLALVREFAGLLGGAVSVTSEPGQGAEFLVDLPRVVTVRTEDVVARAPGTAARFDLQLATGTPALPTRKGAPRLLIAEDSAEMRQYLAELLAPDYELELTGSGREALAAARRQAPAVILSDVMMPDMDGFELTRAVKRDPVLRLIPVVLLTARGGSSDVVRGLEAGADDYLVKPFDPHELHARVQAGLRLSMLHRELASTQEELTRKTRLATLGQLVGTVSHELRNPLATIRNSFQPIRMSSKVPPDTLDRSIARMDRSIDRCVTIIDELLAFSQVREMHLTEVDIDRWLANEVLADLELTGDVSVELALHAGAQVSIDTERMRQAVMNVIANACQAMRDEPDDAAGSRDARIRVSSRRNDDQLEIRIDDSGPGIAPEVLERVFDPLFTTKAFGVGLGLAHVREVLRQHGGDARVESRPGMGTSVSFSMPLMVGARTSGAA